MNVVIHWIKTKLVLFIGLLSALLPLSLAYADGSGPMNPFPISGAISAHFREDREHVSIIEFAGNYDRDFSDGSPNVEPRAVIAREFYRMHPDNYDFLVVFSSFEFSTGDAVAFHWSVQNKVQGIGLPAFDNSTLFGSKGKLQGYIDMAALTRYQTEPTHPAFEWPLGVLAHEMLHQWGSYVKFKQADGSISKALLGKADGHWSYLLDSSASVEYGAKWRDNGNGTYTAVGTRTFFSPLDLYLMGFYKASEVPNFTLIDNPSIDRTQLPDLNVTISGTPRTISINDIIAAEGPRVPDATTAQKEFRLGFVFLVGPNQQVSDAQLLALNNIRNAYMTRFAILTGGRAVAQVYPEALPVATTGTPTTVGGAGVRATPANLEEGLAWLRAHQSNEGFWSDKDTTRQRDTTVVLSTLRKLDGSFTGGAAALGWLSQNPSANNDDLARQASLLAELQQGGAEQRSQLLGLQNSDGGWGLGTGYKSNVLDTALAVLALAGHGVNQAVLDKAGQYLITAQNTDGGWSNAKGSPSRTSVTATVLRALKALNLQGTVAPAAIAFFVSKQNADGGFGDSPSTVHDTANVLQAAIAVDAIDRIHPDLAAAYLLARQSVDGSWDGSVYATASAVSALKRFNFPNWAVTAMTATPVTVHDGDRIRLDITIKNDASIATQAGMLRVYDGDPATGGKAISTDISVPVMGPGATLTLSPLFDTLDKPGAHTMVAVVDPDNAQSEMSKSDNRASVAVSVQNAPQEIDLALAYPDIAVMPAQPDHLPTTLGLSATVRNLGLTDAYAVPVVLLAGPAGKQVEVARSTVDVLNRSNVVANFNYLLTTAGTVYFTVVVDPDNKIAEANKANNTASASVTTLPNVDLAVSNAEVSVNKSPVLMGEDVTFKVMLRNTGTVDSPAAEVRYTITDGVTTQTLRSNTVQIAAGQAVEQQIVWRVDMAGTLRFSVQMDPAGLVPEGNKTNNTASLTLSSGTMSGPNLVVAYQDFTFSPVPGLEGGNVVLSAVVRNTGTEIASNIPVTFFLGDPSAAYDLETVTIPSLAPNTSQDVKITWSNLPTAGDKLLYVVIDPDNTIAEFSETDNSAFNVLSVMSLPDLAIASGDVKFNPAFPRAGETLSIQAQVANLGDQSASNVVVRAFDGDPASGGVQIGADQIIQNIQGHGSASVNFSLNLTAVSTTRPIVVQVDPANQILERNKTNNTAQHDLAVQDGNFYVSNVYFSPNGDGVKDSTEFFFRLANAATVSVEVVNKRGAVVRRFTGDTLSNISAGSVIWNGLDDLGRLVEDGTYKLRIASANGAVTGEVRVTLDTNRSPLLDAVNTKYGSFSNLTCELPYVDLQFTEDDTRAFFGIRYGSSPQVAYPRGIYSMDGTGGDIRAVVPESFFPSVPHTYYDSYLRKYVTYYSETNAKLDSIAASGSKIAFSANGSASVMGHWLTNGDGKNSHKLDSIQFDFWSNKSSISKDGKMLYVWEYPSATLKAVSTDPGAIASAIWSSTDGSYVEIYSESTKIYPEFGKAVAKVYRWGQSGYPFEVIDLNTGENFAVPSEPSFSPDGKYIVAADGVNINIYNMQGTIIKSIPSPIVGDGYTYEVKSGKAAWNSNSAEFAISIALNFASWSCDPFPDGVDAGGIYTVDLATAAIRKEANYRNINDGGGECGYSYHISTWDGAQWVERDVLHHGLFMQRKTSDLSKYLPDATGKFRVRIHQTGHETAHVDDVALLVNRQAVAPNSAMHVQNKADALSKVVAADNEVLHLHEATLEVEWNKLVAGGKIELQLGAREESISKRTDLLPFSYPEASGQVYQYVVAGQRPMVVDGNQTGQDNLGESLFKVYSRPGTGHPAANVYGYVQSDEQYLYAALDFAVDNDEDGVNDWASFRIRKDGVWKDFRITKQDSKHGKVGFIRNGSVNYSHKYYEFKIALADLDVRPGETVEIAFQGYGSAAINTMPLPDSLPNEGQLYWVPGERSLIYYSYFNDFGYQYLAFKLDEGSKPIVLFSEWMDNYSNQLSNLHFSPAGRQMLFTSGRDTNDPSSRCYGLEEDTWSFHSLLNLTADLRAIRSGAGGLRLEGTAADQNFANYTIDYASTDAPEQWRPVMPGSNTPVVDDIFTTWVPPAPGTYFVRLTVQDMAGNTRKTIKRVSWSDTPSITDLYRTPALISPNGDGEQDVATIHYRVLEPVHLEFNFYNQNKDRVRTILRDHSAPNTEENLLWDGRDDNGLPVKDGVYRMTVQNYDFSIEIDTEVPLVTLKLANAYQPKIFSYIDSVSGQLRQKEFVNVAPALSWSVEEKNYLSSLVETGSGSNPVFWNEFHNPDPSETGGGAENQLPLALEQFTNRTFRLTANDRAGNKSILATALGKEELIVEGISNFEINQKLIKNYESFIANGQIPSSTDFKSLISLSGGLYIPLEGVLYLPMQQQDGGTELSAILSNAKARLKISETIRSPLVQTFVQYRKQASSVWQEKAMAGYAVTDVSKPVLVTTQDITNLEMNAVWDLSDLESGHTYVVRLRALDAGGIEHISNSFLIFSGGGYEFKGLISNASPAEKEQFINPLLTSPLTEGEYVLWGKESLSQPIGEARIFARSKDDLRFASERLLGSIAYPENVFILRTTELQACKNYTAYMVLYTEPDATGERREIGRVKEIPITIPCLELKTDVQIQYAQACNDPSPNLVKIRLAPTAQASEAPLKLLTLSRLDPVVGKDVVYNVNKPESAPIPKNEYGYYRYEYMLDTSALPEGELQFQAELFNVNDEVITRSVTVIVDHTPPDIGISYPHESQEVCGVPIVGQDGVTRNVVTLEGELNDANGLHYEMESSLAAEESLSVFHTSRSNGIFNSFNAANGIQVAAIPPEDKPKFHLPGSYSGPLSAIFNQTGTVTTRLRVFDRGGHQQCVISSFNFDGTVAGAYENLNRALFSPNADGVSDSVLVTYGADESATVDIDVFAAVGPDSNGQMQIAGDSLRNLANKAYVLAGTSTIEWDGRGAGGGGVADGKYGIQVVFKDGCGNVKKLVRFVEVDSTPPSIVVAYPTSTSQLPLIVEVQGGVNDIHLQSYVVDYGVGLAPEAWVRLKSGAVNVSNAVLAPWNTYGLQGAYTLRVIGTDTAGNQSTALIPVNLQTPTNIIAALEVSPNPFSPNGDGKRESAAILMSLDQDAVISISVSDAQGSVIRKLVVAQSVAKGALSFSWDGMNDAGQLAPDGVYTIALLATLTSNSFVKQDEKVSVVLDSTVPLIDIKRPVAGFVTGIGGILGSITDLHLTGYKVSLTNSPTAPSWELIDEGSLPRVNAVLGSLAGLSEGEYAIRIEAQDSAENAADKVIAFIVDNTPPKVDLGTPADASVVGVKKTPINISGSIVEKNIKTYSLELGVGANPATWTVLSSGSSLPLPAILNAWDVSALPDGLYTLKFAAADHAGLTGEKRISLIIDNTSPEVAVTSPAEGGYVRLPQDIAGSITDSNLASYKVEIAPGAKGTSANWSELGGGVTPVSNGKLFSWQALPLDGLYTLRVSGKDKADNYSELLVQLTVDIHPPVKPVALKAEVKNRQDVHLSWTANVEADIAGYAVYRDGVRISTSLVLDPFYIDYNVSEGQHNYQVSALDKAGWESELSDSVKVVVDITPPAARIQSPANLATISGLVDIKGTAYSPSDFKEYRLYIAQADAPESRLLLRNSPVPITADLLYQWNTLGLIEGAIYIVTLEAEDINGNIGVAQVSVVIDNLPPLAPTGLEAGVSGSSVQMDWNPNVEPDLLGYLVYRNNRLANVQGTLVGDLRPYAVSNTVYSDNNLADGPYSYTIYAIDKAGNMSLPSNVEQVSIDTHPPHTTISLPATEARFDTPQYVLAVSQDTDIATVQFQYRAAGSATWINLGAPVKALPYAITFDPVSLGLEFGAYQIQSVATDNGGQTDPAPAPVMVNYIDVTRPAMALGLSTLVTGGDVALKWTANKEADLAGYYIDRRSEATGNSVRITPDPLTVTNYVDANVADAKYYYTITAVDQVGNLADPSAENAALVYTPVLLQPYTPIQDAYLASLKGSGVADAVVDATVLSAGGLATLPSLNSDANGMFGWSGIPMAVGDNVFSVSLKDAAGNVSKTAQKTVTFGAAPSKPSGIKASASGYNVTVNWAANPESNIVGYRVFRNGEPLSQLEKIIGVSASASSTNYEYYYGASKAIDGNVYSSWLAGNYGNGFEGEWLALTWAGKKLVSQVSIEWVPVFNEASAVNFDVEAWSGKDWIRVAEIRNNEDYLSNIVLAQTYYTDKLRVVLHYGARADGTVAHPGVGEISVSHAPVQTATSKNDLATDGYQPYTVKAVNSFGFESEPSDSAIVAVGDVTPPDAVTLSGSVSGSDVDLTWTASASADVKRYTLYRDDTLIATHTDLANLRYVDMSRPNGVYRYKVIAIDGANNSSIPSNDVVATVSVALPPAPVDLAVFAAPEGGVLDLVWSAGAGLNPAGYRVLRSTVSGGPYVVVADSAAAQYRDAGLVNGVDYFYVVVALDGLGNASVQSNEVKGTPQDLTTPEVTIHYPTLAGKIYQATESYTNIVARTEPGAKVKLYQNGYLAGQAQARLTDSTVAVVGGVISPSGQYVLEQIDQSLVVHSVDTGSVAVAASSVMDLYNYYWSADSSQIIYFGWDWNTGRDYIRAYKLSDRSTRNILQADTYDWISMAELSPDQAQLAVLGSYQGSYGLWRVDIKTGSWTNIGVPSLSIGSIRWSPDNTRLALLEYSSSVQVHVMHLDSNAYMTIENNAGYVSPEWSGDGSSVLYSSLRDGNEQIWQWSLEGGFALPVTQGTNQHGGASWSPDGKAVAYYEYQPVNGKYVAFIQELNSGAVRALPDFEFITWLSSGYLAAYNYNGQYRMDPAGRVEFKQLLLAAGDNIFNSVATDVSGNYGDPSASIVVNFSVSDRADLVVVDSDVAILPAVPLANEATRITVTVRNQGKTTSVPAVASLVMVDPTGSATNLLDNVALGPIVAGGSQMLAVNWTANSLVGDYNLVATVDPQNLVPEVSETNNLAIRAVHIAGSAKPEVRVVTDRQSYLPAEAVQISAEVINGGDAFNGRVEVVIEDVDGYLVQKLMTQNISGLSYSQKVNVATNWNTGLTFAGKYQVHVVLFDAANQQVAEARTVFVLGASNALSSSIATDRSAYVANTNVQAVAKFNYSGNVVLNGALRVIRIQNSFADTMYQEQQLMGDMLPGSSGSAALDWSTGIAVPGSYQAIIEISKDGVLLSTARTPFLIQESTNLLRGKISLSDQSPAVGTAQTVNFIVENLGNATLSQLPVRVSLVDPDLQSTLQFYLNSQDVAVGGQAAGSVVFGTAGLQLKTYTVILGADVLDASGQNAAMTLATASFPLSDRTPPDVALRHPIANGVTRGDASEIIYAKDELSSVKIVEVSVDGAEWIKVPVSNPGQNLYADLLRGLTEGAHTIVARAMDTWSNTASTAINSFVVDNTSPQIVINGVADSYYYNMDVVPSIVVTDANLNQATVTLNNRAYISDTPVQVDGIYNLAVTANDKAGNSAQKVLRFVVDKAAPVVTVSGIQNGNYYNTDVVPVIDISDLNLSLSTITLNGQPFVSGTIVSAEGSYQLVASAHDQAGNVTSLNVQFTIDKTPPILSITSPVDGAKVSASVIDVFGLTEPNASVSLSMGAYQVTLSADSQGRFTFVEIPLVNGLNSITANARDLAGNVGVPVNLSVTLQAASGEIGGDLSHNGRVLVWLPAKHEHDCSSHHNEKDHDGGSEHNETRSEDKHKDGDYADREDRHSDVSHATDLVYRDGRSWNEHHGHEYRKTKSDGDCNNEHRRVDNSVDAYEQLLALIESTLRTSGSDYRVVRYKDDFVTALRSRRYTTLLFGELQSSNGVKSLNIDDDLAREIQSTVASGVGLAWIKTHPGDFGHGGDGHEERDHEKSDHDDEREGKSNWDKFFGLKTSGVISNLTQVVLTDSVASQMGSWISQPSFALKVQSKTGTVVGKLMPGNQPALILNTYGQGKVAFVAFDPSAIEDPQGAITTLHNILQFAIPVSTTLLPAALTEIRWQATNLNSPIDVRFEEKLPIGMSFLALNGGQLEGAQVAVWEQHLENDHAAFTALVRLPAVVGTAEIEAVLLTKQGSLFTPLLTKRITLDVMHDRDRLGIQVLEILGNLTVYAREKSKLADALESVHKALNRKQLELSDVEYSIERLLQAEALIASLEGGYAELHSKIGLLMTTYQLAWTEAVLNPEGLKSKADRKHDDKSFSK